MKKILFILFLFTMTVQGQFKYYDIEPVAVISELTSEQKVEILDAYAKGKNPMWVKHNVGVKKPLVRQLFLKLRNIEVYAFKSMAGTVQATDSTFYAKVVTQSELLDACSGEFELTQGVLTAILNKMVAYSKRDGTGDWDYYLSQFEE